MDTWLELARGPFFWTALAIMILGLGRQFMLTLWEAAMIYQRAGDKNIPVRRVTRETLQWLVPLSRMRNRWPYSLTTFLFHVGVVLVPLFLAGHVELWKRGTGLAWPSLPQTVATWLTLGTVAAGIAAVVQRAAARASRPLSRFQDYAIPLFISAVFGSGFMVMHPAWNLFSRDGALLAHALCGDLLILLGPLSKLSHMILLPFTQMVSELSWHFPPGAGSRVAVTLGKEHEPV